MSPFRFHSELCLHNFISFCPFSWDKIYLCFSARRVTHISGAPFQAEGVGGKLIKAVLFELFEKFQGAAGHSFTLHKHQEFK